LNRLLFEPEEVIATEQQQQQQQQRGVEDAMAVVRIAKDDARARHVRKVRKGWRIERGRELGCRNVNSAVVCPLAAYILIALPPSLSPSLPPSLLHYHIQILRAQSGDRVRVGVLNGGR